MPPEPAVAPPEPGAPAEAPRGPAAPAPGASSRRWPAWLVPALLLVAGLLVFLPALRAPLFLDDYFQTSMIEGTYPSPRSPFDLYNFVSDADRQVLLDRGLLPWWSHPRITLRFFRPLSSALIYADHRVFGNRPLVSHLHSFAWWAAAAFGARELYRRTLSSRAANLATFMFALAPCHALPMVWLANREALVSLTLGILALGALVRFREEGTSSSLAGATLLFGLALLGGEYALGFGGYALALALTDRRSPAGRRVLALLSFVAPAVVYLAVRARLGCGADGSGLYHDPLRHPLAFLERVPRHLATLLAESWLTLDPDTVDPPTPGWVLGLLLGLGVAVLFASLRRALARLDETRREHATWLLLGSVLSLAPVLAVLPGPRLLGASMLGVAASIALIVDRAWFPPGTEPRTVESELLALVALGLGWGHLVHGPGASWVTTRGCRAEATNFAEHAAALRSRLADPESAEIVVARGISGSVFVLPYALDPRGTPPARFRILALTGHVLVRRQDAHAIELVVPRDSGLFPIGEGNLFRGEGAPLVAGDVIEVPGMRVTVLEIGEWGPRRARFDFEGALESPSRTWINDRFDGVFDAAPPEPGYGKQLDPWPPPDPSRPE